MQAETKAARKLLDHLPSEQSNVLHLYYIRGLTLNAIALRKRISYSYVRRMKKSAEKTLEAFDGAELEALLPKWYVLGKEPGRR